MTTTSLSCRTCRNGELKIAASRHALRRAARLAQSTYPSAASYAAKIPGLKEALAVSIRFRDEHDAVCEVVS